MIDGTAANIVEGVTRALAGQGIDVLRYKARGEPTVEGVQAATDQARETGRDIVIGLGGGDAMDTAKAVAALLTNGGEPLDYLEIVGRGLALSRPSAPCIAVTTTSVDVTGRQAGQCTACAGKYAGDPVGNPDNPMHGKSEILDADLIVRNRTNEPAKSGAKEDVGSDAECRPDPDTEHEAGPLRIDAARPIAEIGHQPAIFKPSLPPNRRTLVAMPNITIETASVSIEKKMPRYVARRKPKETTAASPAATAATTTTEMGAGDAAADPASKRRGVTTAVEN